MIQLYNDDCLDILPRLADNSIDLIIADPPYYNVVNQSWDQQWESKTEYLIWCAQWMVQLYRILKDSGSFYLWGGVGEKCDTIIHQKLIADQLGFYFKDWITWQKSRGMGNRRGWMYTREECLWFVKDNKQFVWNIENQYSTERRKRDGGKDVIKPSQNGYCAKSIYKRLTNVWDDVSENSYNVHNSARFHYTPKPQKLIKRIILAHYTPDMFVVDPFLGSGTTCIVAKELSVNAIGIEKEKQYYDIVKEQTGE